MKILDLLRKLGIFRSGSVGGIYNSSVDRPTEFQMDEVFDSKKDLVSKKKAAGAVTGFFSSSKPDSKKATIGRKVFFWAAVLVAIFFFVGHLSAGFSFSFFVTLVFWIAFLFFLRKFAFFGMFSVWFFVLISILLVFFSLMIFPGNENNSDLSSKSEKSLSQYDGKVFDLKSTDGKFSGISAVKVKKNKDGKEYLSVMYHLKIKDNITINTSIACEGVPSIKGYNYVGNLLTPLSKEKNDPVGAFSQAYCNKEAWPENFAEFVGKTYACEKPVSEGVVTDTFVPNFSKNFYSVEEFKAANTYEVYDGSASWVKNKEGDGCFIDDVLAVSKGKKITSYTFDFLERK